ncbi:MAG TPA: cytochrome P450 [Conexibacter sp.]|nr:cytochrome P450 [Conexibacter sp.]
MPAAAPDLTPLFSPAPQEHAYAVYRELRERAPVLRVPGRRTWLVSTHADVRAIVRDPATWSSHYPEQFGSGLAQRSPDTARTRAAMAEGFPYVPTLLFQDGADHRRHRALLTGALTPARVRALETRIAAIANDLVDRFDASGAVDAVAAYAVPLPIAVLADMLGVAPQDGARFRDWAEQLVELGSAPDEDAAVASIEQYVAFQRYMVQRIEERRARPGDDLLSALVAGGDDATVPELLSICTLLVAAGNDTVTAAIGSLLRRALDDPALLATLRADRSRIPAAIEETLRIDAPVAIFQRKANVDAELRGERIRRGDMAMVIYASANRDPARWQEPDRFVLDRPQIRDHLAFTHGPHHCAGAALARTQARVAFETLLDRFETLALDPSRPPQLAPDLMTRSHSALPLLLR